MVRRGSTVRVRQRALQKPRITGLSFRVDLQVLERGQVWSPLWSLQVENALLASRVARPHAALRRGRRFIAGARYGPISDRLIAVESSVEWPSSAMGGRGFESHRSRLGNPLVKRVLSSQPSAWRT